MRTGVLHIITRLEPGGAQRNTLYTVENLDRKRFTAALAWGPGDPLDTVARRLKNVRLFEITKLQRPISLQADFQSLSQLREAIRQFRPSIVHTHSSKAGILGRLAAKLEGTPIVVHSIHGYGFTPLQSPPMRALFFLVEKIAARWTDHFIAVSRNNISLGIETGLFDRSKVSLIRSGIALKDFNNAGRDPLALRREFGISDHAPLIVQIGNFKAQKAPLDFIRSARGIASEYTSARFVMVGEGPLRSEAEQLAADLGLADTMTFCGWRDDIPNLLAAATVSVLTSRHEGLPRSVVESFASGVPVVATRVDGTSEVVQNGVNGFLAEAGEICDIVEKVCTILANPKLRQRMAAAALLRLEEFDIDLMVRQQEDLYAWLLGPMNS